MVLEYGEAEDLELSKLVSTYRNRSSSIRYMTVTSHFVTLIVHFKMLGQNLLAFLHK